MALGTEGFASVFYYFSSTTFSSVFYFWKRKKVTMKFFSFLLTAVMVGVASAVCSEGMYFLLPLRWAVASMSG